MLTEVDLPGSTSRDRRHIGMMMVMMMMMMMMMMKNDDVDDEDDDDTYVISYADGDDAEKGWIAWFIAANAWI